ncbi:MAG: protease SohB [Gammaproteobacteria bacterium]
MEYLAEYGLFFSKTLTIVVAFIVVVLVITNSRDKKKDEDKLEVKKLNDKYKSMSMALNGHILSKDALKKTLKAEKNERKQAEKRDKYTNAHQKNIFVLNFHGDISASAVTSLRDEITSVLTVAEPEDEIVVRLESSGGMVHSYGLAASQLQRIRKRKIPLTIAVDKVAASGGYMMACVADRIIAAPFAIIGSIGVIAQLPNFNRLLKKHDIEYEQIKAGEYKRTLTVFGENTDDDREKMQADIDDTHRLFKDFITQNRPDLDIANVATGEHWYGSQALELKLVDDIQTSDDYLMEASQGAALYEITYTPRKVLKNKILSLFAQKLTDRLGLG